MVYGGRLIGRKNKGDEKGAGAEVEVETSSSTSTSSPSRFFLFFFFFVELSLSYLFVSLFPFSLFSCARFLFGYYTLIYFSR